MVTGGRSVDVGRSGDSTVRGAVPIAIGVSVIMPVGSGKKKKFIKGKLDVLRCYPAQQVDDMRKALQIDSNLNKLLWSDINQG